MRKNMFLKFEGNAEITRAILNSINRSEINITFDMDNNQISILDATTHQIENFIDLFMQDEKFSYNLLGGISNLKFSYVKFEILGEEDCKDKDIKKGSESDVGEEEDAKEEFYESKEADKDEKLNLGEKSDVDVKPDLKEENDTSESSGLEVEASADEKEGAENEFNGENLTVYDVIDRLITPAFESVIDKNEKIAKQVPKFLTYIGMPSDNELLTSAFIASLSFSSNKLTYNNLFIEVQNIMGKNYNSDKESKYKKILLRIYDEWLCSKYPGIEDVNGGNKLSIMQILRSFSKKAATFK